jgi:hypothetical protein
MPPGPDRAPGEKFGAPAQIGIVIVGVLLGGVGFLLSGLVAAFYDCEGAMEDSEAWVCDSPQEDLLITTELLAIATCALAPLVGAIISARSRGIWGAVWGFCVAVAAFFILVLLTGFQEITVS